MHCSILVECQFRINLPKKKKTRTPHFEQNEIRFSKLFDLNLANCSWGKKRMDKIVDNRRCGIPWEWRAEGPKKTCGK